MTLKIPVKLTYFGISRPLRVFIFSVLLACVALPGNVSAGNSSFNLLDARERGVSKSDSAKGTATPTFDDTTKKDVLELDYHMGKGSGIDFWAKSFPSELGPETASAVKISVRATDTEQVEQISTTLEIKGTKDIQSIPLQLKAGWNTVKEFIDWEKIGGLSEISFSVSQITDAESVRGTLDLSLDFIQGSLAPKENSLKEATAPVAPIKETLKGPVVTPPRSSFNLLDARDKRVIGDDSAKGTLTPTFDGAVDKDVLEFSYSIPKGSTLKARATSFPAELKPAVVNMIRIGIRVLNAEQANQVAMNVEIEGTKDAQTIPLRLKSGWNSVQESIDWEKIGVLDGVAFVISPVGGAGSVRGSFTLALDFIKRASMRQSNLPSDIPSSFSLLDAGEKGVFNIGASQGSAKTAFDPEIEKDIWKFDYSLPVASVVGVWSKNFPPDLARDQADAVRIGVNMPNADQANEIFVKVEIKGARGMQSLPLSLKPGRNIIRESINWNTIGDLKEVVFVVSPMAANPIWFNPTTVEFTKQSKPLTGTLYFELDFGQLTSLQRNFTYVKVGLVLLVAFLFALFTTFFERVFPQRKPGRTQFANDQRAGVSVSETSILSRLKRDSFYGIMAVFVMAVALGIDAMGVINPLDAGFGLGFLTVALAGGLIAELFKFGLTNKHLTPGEVFQNVLVTGLLAVASSKQELLQSPASWIQALTFSNLIATLTFLIYHIANACSLASSGKHLKMITTVLIVCTPHLFNWLLLLENESLLQTLISNVTGGIFAAWPAVLGNVGRVLIIFGFNEAITNGISLALNGKLLKTLKAHLLILLVSSGVVLSPVIANLGSAADVASLPVVIRSIIAVLTVMFSFAGLWGEVYLITGVSLDAGKRIAPSVESISKNVATGAKKGAAYSGILVALLYTLGMLLNAPGAQFTMSHFSIVVGILAGALVFPLLKTIIETFDGSLPFFERVRYSYQNATLCLRGAVAGFGFAYMITNGLFQQQMSDRIIFGLMIGLAASGGVSILRDAMYAAKGHGRIQSWRLYLIDSLLGAFVGSAAAFYLDSLQVPVIIDKFKLYISSGLPAVNYTTYPLLNKWGRIDLGNYTGGVKLLFIESLAGVINWSIAAWLFAINKVFMQAFFDKDKTPIRFFFSKAGFNQLIEHMIYVLRWGLWMSPIIFTFLRMMPQPTWYNQDGAIRTLFAIYHQAAMSPQAFQEWSLKIFVYILAFDFFRILIWMDHMGLRVATLVNLSFLGLDKLDEKIARFIGPAAAQRYIPEGIKRFATWAPLLIPFYIPRGEAWDYAWNTSDAIQNAARGKGILYTLQSLTLLELLLVSVLSFLICTAVSFAIRLWRQKLLMRRIKTHELTNRRYKVTLKENGEAYSEIDTKKSDVYPKEYDISRRSYDLIDPSGRVLYLVDASAGQSDKTSYWPVVGNFPGEKFVTSRVQKLDDSLRVINESNGVRTVIEIRLPDEDAAAELWTITVTNLSDKPRELKVVPYLEWVLNGGLHDRFHTQYARLFPEMEYVSQANAILAWHKGTKSIGILAADLSPQGFVTSRMDFIGRARSIWSPRILQTLNFLEAQDTAPYPTFDPIGSFMINLGLGQSASKTLRLMIGYAKDKESALDLVRKHLKPEPTKAVSSVSGQKKVPLIGHGEIPIGTPQPYFEYRDNGNKLLVRTPFTPRPFDHALSNAVHSVMVTNRGLHTSCNGNSQQNRLTPDWPDTVTKEVPGEAIYLYDPDRKEWYSPTYHPLNNSQAKHESEFGVDGTAVFRMMEGTVSTELTVFVPPHDPAGVYLLTIRNHADHVRRMRIAPYFEMTLAFQPERSGPLGMHHDKKTNALFFENPRNMFRSGWAFASMSIPAERVETRRGRFFGTNRGVTHPFIAEKGEPDVTHLTDNRQIAGFLGTVEIPAHGECTLAVVMGQTDDRKQAAQLVQKFKSIESARTSLSETRAWWKNLMGTMVVETNHQEFDQFLNWLKYQALAERIWARRGFYQTSGAFGFRDQLQDTVNLIWVDPALARKQILLHASHQFVEGDVFHWFFTLPDGRTAFSCRSHASDNPVWLSWGVMEYVKATGDESILDEMVSYVVSEFPFAPLPKNKQGWGHLYHRSTRADSLYKHCMTSIDLVLEKRMGKNGLPLMGTGDWNDGLDEIGSEGRGESVWLGFFLYYILKDLVGIIEKKEGARRKQHYLNQLDTLKFAIERTWRTDRYLRAFHDDGTEVGLKDSGIWEIDALTAAWAVMSGINPKRGLVVFNAALEVLEKDNAILLGWPALREDTKPYLGRSSKYPEGVRENGMYCHGVQWLVKAARVLAEQFEKQGNQAKASEYRATAYRLWLKISPLSHVKSGEIEIYGGQPNKQSADILTNFDRGRMIWQGYTGAAGWMFRQAIEGVVGASLVNNKLIIPNDIEQPRGELKVKRVHRNPGVNSPNAAFGESRLNSPRPVSPSLKDDFAFPRIKSSVVIK